MNFLQGANPAKCRYVRDFRRGCAALGFAILLCAPSSVLAQSLRKVKITFEEGGRVRTKSIYCQAKTPGTAKKQGAALRFTSFASIIKSLKSSPNSGSKLSLNKKYNSLGKAACKATGNPNPTPTPRATPVPTQGPTGIFDNFGNVTASGKAVLGIPSNLSANVSTGKNIFNSYCTGCHDEHRNRTFGQYRVLIMQSPMLYDDQQIPDDWLASITAYLNRFRF